MTKRKYSCWDPKNIAAEATEWLDTPKSSVYGNHETWTAEIEEALTEDLDSVGKILRLLDSLAQHYFTVAELQIMNGNIGGWAEMKKGFRYGYWAIRISVRRWELNTRRTKSAIVSVEEAGKHYALGVSLGANAEAMWLGDRLSRSREDGAFGCWDSGRLGSYLLTLYLRSKGDNETVVVPQTWGLGPYSYILDQWNTRINLSEAILEVCEYHLDHTCESDEELTEFVTTPFIYIPVEIISLEKIRANLGLETPRPDHELFSTPFANPPEQIKDLDDPFLDRVINYFEEAIGLPN